jgi:cold shock CspA family protein
MKHTGTVRSFDAANGRGTIEADSGGELLIFERTGIYLNSRVSPSEGQRLTYELGISGGKRCAVNIANV